MFVIDAAQKGWIERLGAGMAAATGRVGKRMKFLAIAAALLSVLFASALPAQPPAASPPKMGTEATYKISAGDALDIYVWGDERLQRSMSVLPDGTFAFPLAGTISAAGRTPTQVEAELSRLLAPQYKGVAPQVTVSVKTPSGMQVSVIGKVRSPGTFSPIRYVSALDALTLAGGPTEFADVNGIVVLRKVNGKSEVLRTRLGAVLKGRPGEADLGGTGNPQLMAGDTVVVP
jgi:polysaccharide biosynthesis/export protein